MTADRISRIVAALALGAVLATAANAQAAEKPKAAAKQAAAKVEPQLEPKAVELLKAMSATLAAAHSMSFTAVSTYESPSRLGPPLAYTTLSEVFLARPDKLRVISPGDGPPSEFYYDGKTMTAFAPADNFVAIADAPPTIDAALKAAYESAAIYFPFTDVVVADPYKDIADGLTIAFVIGQSHVVGGTTTDMVAFANDAVFAQIWIGADDKLPRLLRAVYKNDPVRLRQQVEFSNWKLNGEVPPDAFTSSRLGAATRIKFAPPEPQPPAKGAAKKPAKPAATK